MDDEVFRALADSNRRTLLDRLFERDGQTLGDLETALPGMTRFGVMKHLRVLEAAGLVTSRKVGRERHHYLNAVPIRRIHDRWLDRYRIRAADLLDDFRIALEAPMTAQSVDVAAPPRYVFTTYIRSTPQRIWQALTDSDFTVRYYYNSTVHSDWAVGSRYEYRHDDAAQIEGEVLEADAPRRLVLSFHALWSEAVRADAPSKMVFEIDNAEMPGVSKLTVIHEDLEGRDATRDEVVGGWPLIAAGLKTLLETGEPLVIRAADATA
jgi:uncharacterized protein YndB with AHSA1/START domain/DNA-binding transcriptional ArsR family regulator